MSKASTYQRRARDYAQREDWDAALAELRQAVAADASNPMLHNQMGDLFVRKEEVQEACANFEKAIDLYSDLGLHANAVALCRKVLRLCPSRVEVRFRLARLRHDQGLQAETAAAFADYLEHLPARRENDVRALEERCREIVEQFPQAAPIGKILEKLEEARAFDCAFEIVQRLAQRAADAGDDEAARRYTTKMRSLRVLVEGRGGDLLGKPTHREDGESVAATFGTRTLEPAAAPPPPLPLPAADAGALQLEDIRGTIARAAFGDVADEDASDVPEIEIDTDTFAPVDDTPPAPAATATPSADEIPNEYELPETPLAEIASLFTAPADAAPQLESEAGIYEIEVPEALDAPPEEALAALPPEVPAFAPAAEADATTSPPDPPFVELEVASAEIVPETPVAFGTEPMAPEDVSPAPETLAQEAIADLPLEPEVAASAAGDAGDDGVGADAWTLATTATPDSEPEVAVSPTPPELFTPVWVPDENSGELVGPHPLEGGSTYELVEVIDTFRRQMALALGDDAAARYDLGVAYFEMGLYEEAMAEFEVARGHVDWRERSLEMLAACMAMQGRHTEILDLLTPVVKTQADPSLGLGLRYSMGVACEALGRRSEARLHFEAVAQVDSTYRDVSARLQRV